MTGQLCGRCGTALAPEGCPCGWSGSNEETAVIPVIGGPELVRPYFRPDGSQLDGDPDDGEFDDAEIVEIVDAELLDVPAQGPAQFSGQASGRPPARAAGGDATRVLPAYLPAQRSAEPLGSLVVTQPPQSGRSSRGRQKRSSRSTVLIAAGVVLIAGIGVAAALVPKILGGGQVNIAQPQPLVTAPLPSQGPTSGSARPSASATGASTQAAPVVQPTHSASASAAPSTAPASAQPTATATATATAGGTPSSPTASATPTGGGSSSGATGTLSLGDTGPAVATLQQDLASLWIDPGLQASGVYNQQTESDVATFQYWYGVQGDPSGVYGPNSQARMAKAMKHQNGNNG